MNYVLIVGKMRNRAKNGKSGFSLFIATFGLDRYHRPLTNSSVDLAAVSLESENPRNSVFGMSRGGVRQLKELLVRYSDLDGSSRGVREWMRTSLVEMAKSNPELSIKTELKRAVHPFLRGVYANGNSKTICVKNIPSEDVHSFAMDLRNQIGRKTSNNGYKKPVYGTRPSIQGEWHERMDVAGVELKVDHK